MSLNYLLCFAQWYLWKRKLTMANSYCIHYLLWKADITVHNVLDSYLVSPTYIQIPCATSVRAH